MENPTQIGLSKTKYTDSCHKTKRPRARVAFTVAGPKDFTILSVLNTEMADRGKGASPWILLAFSSGRQKLSLNPAPLDKWLTRSCIIRQKFYTAPRTAGEKASNPASKARWRKGGEFVRGACEACHQAQQMQLYCPKAIGTYCSRTAVAPRQKSSVKRKNW